MNVLLLHAFPLDERMWEPQWEVLEEHEVTAPRLYGRGPTMAEWADSVAAEAQRHLLREGARGAGVAHRHRRAEHQRPRAGDMAARVRVRSAHVPEHEVVGSELALEPVDVHDGGQLRHGRETRSGSR